MQAFGLRMRGPGRTGAFRAAVVLRVARPGIEPAGLRILFLPALMSACPPYSQILAPGNPSKEYICAGDRLVAIITRGSADFALTARPASQSVTAGESAYYTVQVTATRCP
jgi:hypothetical protein